MRVYNRYANLKCQWHFIIHDNDYVQMLHNDIYVYLCTHIHEFVARKSIKYVNEQEERIQHQRMTCAFIWKKSFLDISDNMPDKEEVTFLSVHFLHSCSFVTEGLLVMRKHGWSWLCYNWQSVTRQLVTLPMLSYRLEKP